MDICFFFLVLITYLIFVTVYAAFTGIFSPQGYSTRWGGTDRPADYDFNEFSCD